MGPLSTGSIIPISESRRITDAPSTGSRTRERLPVELLKLRAETFAFQLERDRQCSLTTGKSMPPEWTASLERERQSLLTQIQCEETITDARSSPSLYTTYLDESTNATETVIIHAPIPRLLSYPSKPSTLHHPEGHGRSSVPYSVQKRTVSHPRPVTIPASTQAISSHALPPAPRVTEHISPGPVVESDDDADEGISRTLALNRKQERLEQRSITRSVPPHHPATTTRPPSRSRPPPLKLLPTKADVQATLVNGIGEHTESPERRHFGDDCPLSLNHPPTPVIESHDRRRSTDDYPLWPNRPSTPTPLSPPNLAIRESGRNSARGWYSTTPKPEAKESLHRFVLSPTRPYSPASAKTIGSEKRVQINDEKLWTVFKEVDDEPHSPVHEIFSSEPNLAAAYTTHQFDTKEFIPPPCTPSITQIRETPTRTSSPLSIVSSVTRSSGMPTTIPPLPPYTQYSSTYSSTSICKPSTTSRSSETGGITRQVVEICIRLADVFRDLTKYKKFLSYRDEAAQSLLNFLQTLLDYSKLEERFRTILFVALVRLSRKSGLCPQCLTLPDVIREGEYPVTDGHFGEIYKGYLRERVVCLKVVKMYDSSNQALLYKAFAREAVLWGQLSHTNVLPFFGIYRLGDARNRIGLVSPWMKHSNVNEFLRQQPNADRCLLISDVAAGLLYLHKNGVVHGDLKGVNVLVNDSGRACLADFGLSSVTDAHGLKAPSLSSANAEGGTVRFQAPELIDPNIEGVRSKASDIYAFALVCYEILTGNCPFFDVKSNYTVMLKVGLGERPARPSGPVYLNRGLTDRMWGLIEDCWEHLPKNRPNAFQVVERLPPRMNTDPRGIGGWGDLSPSKFRALGRDDASVAEKLRVLETSGISLFQL